MRRLRLVVIGTAAANPYAGMAWMHMQITAGLRRLGHDVYYVEVTSAWPYDPLRCSPVADSNYSVPYLATLAERFDLADRWAYRRSYSDGAWLGMNRTCAEELLATADAVFNISGATRPRSREGFKINRLVYIGTDPVYHEMSFAHGDRDSISLIDEHDDVVTYGENIGNPECSIPSLPRLRSRMRQPVLVDLWQSGAPLRSAFTTVSNWRQEGRDLEYLGDTYYWSKDREFLKFVDLPQRVAPRLELAVSLADASSITRGPGEVVHSGGLPVEERNLLTANGWCLADAAAFTNDPWAYRDYVRSSAGEFTVAKDQNVRLRSGWFSERSACYLAAGRPVITQDTGFNTVLPTGEGLFPFTSMDDIVLAFDAICSDYDRHSRAARSIAEEYFRAETVLSKLLSDLGL